MASTSVSSLPHLDPGEASLLNLAIDDPRDTVPLSDREALVLQLYNQIHEQELEKALLEQGTIATVGICHLKSTNKLPDPESLSGDNVQEQLATAERDLLQSRATYTVRRKAIATVLMTDPTLKAVHMKATSSAERSVFYLFFISLSLLISSRSLLRLVNRRDVLSFAHENLTASHNSTRKSLSSLELENLQINRKNQELVRQLLELTGEDSSWREELDDPDLKAQLEELEAEHKKSKAKWEVMKNIAGAVVVGSGVNWAEDQPLSDLVLDEMDD